MEKIFQVLNGRYYCQTTVFCGKDPFGREIWKKVLLSARKEAEIFAGLKALGKA